MSSSSDAPTHRDSHSSARPARWLRAGQIFRYPRPADPDVFSLDGYVNFFSVTRSDHNSRGRVQLEAGINQPSATTAPDGPRTPVILLRSSPSKHGQPNTPWEDVFDHPGRKIIYYGDHKPDTKEALGDTAGNKALLAAERLHNADERQQRLLAPPIFLFRGTTLRDGAGAVRPKGFVEFIGLARVFRVVRGSYRTDSGREYNNYEYHLTLLQLEETRGQVDWTWIQDRQDASLTADETLRAAPRAWINWTNDGS